MEIAQNPFGRINPPPGVARFSGGQITGVPTLLNIILRTLILGAAIFAVFNLVLAGYAYLSAAGDPKRIQVATEKIWQSLLGLTVAAGAFVLAGVIGQILFGDPNALLQFRYFTP